MRLSRGEAGLAIAPDGFHKLELFGGVEIAFNFAVTLLDRTEVTALLQVVDVLLRHAMAACQQVGHRVQFAEHLGTHCGPHLGISGLYHYIRVVASRQPLL